MKFSRDELLKEAQRELGMRRAVYPGMIERGRLRPREADRRIALQEAICEAIETGILPPHAPKQSDIFGDTTPLPD